MIKANIVIKSDFILILLLNILACWGQDYFPLQVGNAWYLTSIPEYIEKAVIFDSLIYYQFLSSNYYRRDSLNKVYMRTSEGEEWLQYDFQADVGDSWLYGSVYKFRVILESKADIIALPIGTFHDCYKFSFYGLNVIDGDYSVWLAPDVGLVRTKSIDWGGESELSKARVNGKKIPDFPVPLKLIQTIPTNGQRDVPIDAQVVIQLNFSIKNDLINADNITVFSKNYGIVTGSFTNITKYSSNKITFTPNQPFSYNDSITVTISTTIEDYTGDHLSENYQFSFTVEKEEHQPTLFAKDSLSKFLVLKYGDFDWGDFDSDGDKDLILLGTIDSVDVGLFHYVELYENHSNFFQKKEMNFVASTLILVMAVLNGLIMITMVCWTLFTRDGILPVILSLYFIKTRMEFSNLIPIIA